MSPNPLVSRPAPRAASRWGGRRRRLAAAIVWLLLAVLVALGAAGIVTGVGGYPGSDSRPELTWAGDEAIRPDLASATEGLRALSSAVESLGTTGRGALTALVATDRKLLESTVDSGTSQLTDIRTASAAMRARLLALPGIGPDAGDPLPATSELVLGRDVRDRFRTIFRALSATSALPDAWARFTSGSLAAEDLTTLLADHDASTADAAKSGRGGDYAGALTKLGASDALIAEARTLRDRLANTVDVSVLTEWLDRNATYDAALRALYTALEASKGLVTDAVRAAFDAERAAKDRLPPDTRGLVVILAEIARGGMNQAVIAIEDARGQLDAALAALQTIEATPAPSPSG